MNRCVLSSSICVRINNEIRTALDEIINKYKIKIQSNDDNTKLKVVMKQLNIEEEDKLWLHPQVIELIGLPAARDIIFRYYKTEGPAYTDELLSNVMIDDILKKWELNCIELFKLNFYTIPCQCIDFYSYPNPLHDFNYDYLLEHDSMAVVLNTDTSKGPGKHWICVYIRNTTPSTVYFFNSSSNPPPPNLENWICNVIFTLRIKYNKQYGNINVVPSPIQKSATECGMWCLYFILSQLLGFNHKFILSITDADVMKYRQIVFSDTTKKKSYSNTSS